MLTSPQKMALDGELELRADETQRP